MHLKDGTVQSSACQASRFESLNPAYVPAVDAEVAARVGVEFERYVEMRKAARKLTGSRRRSILSETPN